MSKFKLQTVYIEVLSAFFIFLFGYTAINKILDHNNFIALLSQSTLTARSATLIAWMLPVAELLTVVFLILPATRKLGFKMTFASMAVFTIYVTYMLLFVHDLPCSCGGVISSMTWQQHLLFNSVLTILSAIGLWLIKNDKFFIAINRSSRTPV